MAESKLHDDVLASLREPLSAIGSFRLLEYGGLEALRVSGTAAMRTSFGSMAKMVLPSPTVVGVPWFWKLAVGLVALGIAKLPLGLKSFLRLRFPCPRPAHVSWPA